MGKPNLKTLREVALTFDCSAVKAVAVTPDGKILEDSGRAKEETQRAMDSMKGIMHVFPHLVDFYYLVLAGLGETKGDGHLSSHTARELQRLTLIISMTGMPDVKLEP